MSMLTETLIFAGFALLLSTGIWWTWRQRELAQRQAEMNARLAELGKSVNGVAHDMGHLVNLLITNLQIAGKWPDASKSSVADAEEAALALNKLLLALRARQGDGAKEVGSTEGVVRLAAALLKGAGAEVEVHVKGDLIYRGSQTDALRVVQNLLSNAAREVSQIRGGRIVVELREDLLRITNPVRSPATLDESIYASGVSHSGSTGDGLAICRSAAERLGWSVRHELEGDFVTFIVAPQPGQTELAS